jgi:hypothetical protein
MIVYSKYINQCEMRLHKRFHMFDFIYYDNTMFHSPNHTHILHILALFVQLISHQPTVLFSQNKSATSNQQTLLFSQNKPASAIDHQPNEQPDYL